MTAVSAVEARHLAIEVDAGVAWVELNAPPVQIMTWRMVRELHAVARAADNDPDIRVLVFTSAHPEFWPAHFDIEPILNLTVNQPAAAARSMPARRSPGGWLNRALPRASLAAFVEDLARRLATFDPAAVAPAAANRP